MSGTNKPLSVSDAISNGPVGQTLKSEKDNFASELRVLSDSKRIPDHPAATGQPLTQFHSMFYRLLSWDTPRTTGSVYAFMVSAILAFRYIDIPRYLLKASYWFLGVAALAELIGKNFLNQGLATRMRPEKYWTIRKESLERFTGDLEQLINFAVIEFQRIIFVENPTVTALAWLSTFIGYFLIKLLPFWGLSLLTTNVVFLTPLLYITNKQFIDEHLKTAGRIINDQTHQVIDLASQHTNHATEAVKGYTQEYAHLAQQKMNDLRGKATNGSAMSPPSDRANHVTLKPNTKLADTTEKITPVTPVRVEAITPVQPTAGQGVASTKSIRVEEPVF